MTKWTVRRDSAREHAWNICYNFSKYWRLRYFRRTWSVGDSAYMSIDARKWVPVNIYIYRLLHPTPSDSEKAHVVSPFEELSCQVHSISVSIRWRNLKYHNNSTGARDFSEFSDYQWKKTSSGINIRGIVLEVVQTAQAVRYTDYLITWSSFSFYSWSLWWRNESNSSLMLLYSM